MSRGHAVDRVVADEEKRRSESGIRFADGDTCRRISTRWAILSLRAMPELEVSGPEAEAARRFYCGTIGVEFMHIPDRERRLWIQERMESEAPEVDRARILELLIKAEIFEQTMQSRYLGTKRFSLEGEAALLPLLDAILSAASEYGAEKGMLAMSHRGRLNVMVNIVGRRAGRSFCAFRRCRSAQHSWAAAT